MEAVHKPEKRAWIDGTLINVKQFLTDWVNTLPSENSETSNSYVFLEDWVSEEEYKNAEKECGLHTMKCLHQDLVEPSNSITIPKGVDLLTVRSQADDLKKRAGSTKYTASVYHTMKYSNYPPLKNLSSLTDLSKIPFEPVIFPDVALCVQTYLPERRLDPNAVSASYTKMPAFQLDQEFLVLGNQYLTELRDKIFCISDKAVPYELSDCPTDKPVTTCEDLYKSGFFYINGVFYNDMRDKDCRDYSETIINWASNGNHMIGPFKKAIMEKSRFIDLSIQLGYPYVYTHQGDCEHLIVFSDLRLLSKHDVNNRNAYPLYVQVKPAKRIFCMVCHEYTASWVVFGNKRLPENPFFFCKTCFINFNYDNENQKIGDFKAYHFPDNSKLKDNFKLKNLSF